MSVVPQVLSIQEFLLGLDPGLGAEVARHDDRTMTIVSLRGLETITRCKTCPKEDARPCTALRILALPYAQHPSYRPEWEIPSQPGAARSTAGEDATVPAQGLAGGHVPPPYPRIADMPPPGNARRRLLRQFGIRISRSDFTDEELALRGSASDPRGRRPNAE